jgi:putative salt-induced outer membrane protein YdiY
VGTSGNSDTASTGADFSAHRRGLVWQIESSATAVRTNSLGETTAERYLGMLRGQRKLTPIIGLTTGAKLERDRFSGLDFRSILDGGLSWALVHHPEWTLDGLTSLAWLHESRTVGGIDDPIGVFQLLSRIPFGTAGDTTQRYTFYPDFKTSAAYRSELEISAQAAMNTRLALKIGYLLRYSNDPVPGFKKTDNTTTASVVLRWKATTNAAAP